jgi:hypothetical protein
MKLQGWTLPQSPTGRSSRLLREKSAREQSAKSKRA